MSIPDATSSSSSPGRESGRRLTLQRTPTTQVDPGPPKPAQLVKAFLEKKEGSCLRAWLRQFDVDQDEHVTLTEFSVGMRTLGYTPADCGGKTIPDLFSCLDSGKSGELSLEDIDVSQASLWRSFRAWSVTSFGSARDMIRVLGGREAVLSEALSQEQWCAGLQRSGWKAGMEEVLFSTLNFKDTPTIGLESFKWLDMDLRRKRRKDAARERAVREGRMKPASKDNRWQLLEEFKAFLKRKWGNYLRAWRCGLSPNDCLVLQKRQFLKACADIGWHRDVKTIWRAFDKDDNGDISIEELDLPIAACLASLQDCLQRNFSGVAEAFKAFDKSRLRKLREPDFTAGLKSLGFSTNLRQLFHGLDREGKKWLALEDLLFLDRWKPPAYLLARPNPKAKEELRACLLQKFKTYLRAWRRVLDMDGNNRCNWNKFQSACEKINFIGDVAGAWRALDCDLSGYICLKELDPVSSQILNEFKHWANTEFGSVRSAFDVFDNDGSKSITYQEFRRCCRIYNYEGDTHLLFRAFDIEDAGCLNLKEIGFLDDWDPNDEDLEGSDGVQTPPPDSLMQIRRMPSRKDTSTRLGADGDSAMKSSASLHSSRRLGSKTDKQPPGGSLKGEERDATNNAVPGQPGAGYITEEEPSLELGDVSVETDMPLDASIEWHGRDLDALQHLLGSLEDPEEEQAAAEELASDIDALAIEPESPSTMSWLPAIVLTKGDRGDNGRRGAGMAMPTLDDLLVAPRSTPAAFRRPRRLVRLPQQGAQAAVLVRLPIGRKQVGLRARLLQSSSSRRQLGRACAGSAPHCPAGLQQDLSAPPEEVIGQEVLD